MIFLQYFVWVTQTTTFTMFDSPQKRKMAEWHECKTRVCTVESGTWLFHGRREVITDSKLVYYFTHEDIARERYAGDNGQVFKHVPTRKTPLLNLNVPKLFQEMFPTDESREMAQQYGVLFYRGDVPDWVKRVDYSFWVKVGEDNRCCCITRVSDTMNADDKFNKYLLNRTVWERLCEIAGVSHLDGTFWSGDSHHDEIWFRKGVRMEPKPLSVRLEPTPLSYESPSKKRKTTTREDVTREDVTCEDNCAKCLFS